MTNRNPVDGAEPEVQREFDRIWYAIDALDERCPKRPPVVTPLVQHAPAPDYRVSEPVVAAPCSCEEALALRSLLKAEISRRVEHRQVQSLNEQLQSLEKTLADSQAHLLDAVNWLESPQHTLANGAKLCARDASGDISCNFATSARPNTPKRARPSQAGRNGASDGPSWPRTVCRKRGSFGRR